MHGCLMVNLVGLVHTPPVVHKLDIKTLPPTHCCIPSSKNSDTHSDLVNRRLPRKLWIPRL